MQRRESHAIQITMKIGLGVGSYLKKTTSVDALARGNSLFPGPLVLGLMSHDKSVWKSRDVLGTEWT